MQGMLSPGFLPQLLGEVYLGRKTGTLLLCRNREQLKVFFTGGTIVGVDTRADERPETSLPAPDDSSSLKLASVLKELGIKRRAPTKALDQRERLGRALAWKEGSYTFEGNNGSPGEDAALILPTEQVIVEAIRRIDDLVAVRGALGDLDRVLILSVDPAATSDEVTLSATDGHILSRVDGVLSANALLEGAELPRAECEKSLLGLLLRGLVEFLPASAVPAQSEPTPPGEAAPPPAVEHWEPALPEPALAPPPPPSPAPTPAPLPGVVDSDESPEDRRRRIQAACAALPGKNHFEVLGVPENAPLAQIDQAYRRLAERFDPDRNQHPSLADLRDELQAVFIRATGAHAVLSRPESRAAYQAELARRRARETEAAPVVDASGPTLSPNEAEMALLVEDKLHRGERLIGEGNYWDAIQVLQGLLGTVQGKRYKQRTRLLLARAYMKNPNWVRRAEELLLTAIHEDPRHVDAHFMLGSLYKVSGLHSRAVAMFRKVLELKPDHKGAMAEVSAGSVLLRKLFGRH